VLNEDIGRGTSRAFGPIAAYLSQSKLVKSVIGGSVDDAACEIVLYEIAHIDHVWAQTHRNISSCIVTKLELGAAGQGPRHAPFIGHVGGQALNPPLAGYLAPEHCIHSLLGTLFNYLSTSSWDVPS
jgi:hypothetical protein